MTDKPEVIKGGNAPEPAGTKPIVVNNAVDFTKFLSEEKESFGQWRNAVLETISTQEKITYRTDTFVGLYDGLDGSKLMHDAYKIASASDTDSAYQRQDFIEEILEVMHETLEKIWNQIYDLYYYDAVEIGIKGELNPLSEDVVYLKQDTPNDLLDIFWGNIEFQCIRPYGEKLNDAIRSVSERFVYAARKLGFKTAGFNDEVKRMIELAQEFSEE